MPRFFAHRLFVPCIAALAILPPAGVTADVALLETQQRLLENQRNVYRLQEELQLLQEELQLARLKQERGDNSEALQREINDLRDSYEIGDVIINNLNDTISRQRLLLGTMERATAPSTLEMALNKALNADLTALAQSLSHNEQARREVAHLRSLLKEQAGLGIRHVETPSSVSYAAEQLLAEDEYLRLLELFSSESPAEPASGRDKPIRITGINDNKPFSRDQALSYLGHSQYHLETMVHRGRMTFTVDGRPWHMTIPPEEDKATYIVIYDVTSNSRPRLVLFNKSLLLE